MNHLNLNLNPQIDDEIELEFEDDFDLSDDLLIDNTILSNWFTEKQIIYH